MTDTLFLQDILNTPQSLSDTLAALSGETTRVARALLDRGARRFVALGSGSSLYAAAASIYLHNALAPSAGTLAWAAPTGDYALYPAPLSPADALVGVSVSGEIIDLLDLFESLRGHHQLVAITNTAGSSLTRLADHALLMKAGRALVPTSTKTFVASVAALDLLWLSLLQAQGVAEADDLRGALLAAPQAVSDGLEQAKGQIALAADRLEHCRRFFIFGAGPAWAVAQEAALVFQEVAGLPATAMQAREMAQGAISVINEQVGVIAINPPGRGQAAARQVLAQCVSFGAATLELGASPAQLALDVSCPDLLSPLVYSGPAFVLANELAARRGADTDHPSWEAAYLRAVRRADGH